MLPVHYNQEKWLRDLWKRRKCILRNDLQQSLFVTFHT